MNVSKTVVSPTAVLLVFCLHFDLTKKTLFTFFNGKFLIVVVTRVKITTSSIY